MTGWAVVVVGYAIAALVWIGLVWLGLRSRRP